jgi:hypothetical protein
VEEAASEQEDCACNGYSSCKGARKGTQRLDRAASRTPRKRNGVSTVLPKHMRW